MKNLAIENRVLQRDRVLQRRVLERYYCNTVTHDNTVYHDSKFKAAQFSQHVWGPFKVQSHGPISDSLQNRRILNYHSLFENEYHYHE